MSAFIAPHYRHFQYNSCDSRNTARVGTVRSAHRGVSSADEALLDVDILRKAADGVGEGVLEREVLTREAWTARAEAHRQR